MSRFAIAAVFVMLASRSGVAQTTVRSPLERECIRYRASGFKGSAGSARLVMEQPEPRFKPRSALLTRQVMCGFLAGKLARATERFYLRLLSEDMVDPGFTTGNPTLSNRYYLVCEGSVGTALAAFKAGQLLTFADNMFTLPCGHSIYPVGATRVQDATPVTGVYGYRMESAALRVSRAPSLRDPRFEFALDAVETSPRGTLHLRGRVAGTLATTVVVVNCPTERRFTKQASHPACP
jgi:hypothetical protein